MLVIMSCDDNPYYFDFWEPVSYVWKEKMGLMPVLVHFGEKTPSNTHGAVIKMPIDPDIPVHTHCQLSRIWVPKLFENQFCMTSDIDMIPLSRKYWNPLGSMTDEQEFDWLHLNSSGDYYPICYNIAKSETYKDVLELDDNFNDFMKKVVDETSNRGTHDIGFGKFENWFIDEEYLSNKLTSKKDKIKILQADRPGGHPNGSRIDRDRWGYHLQSLKDGNYIDCHSIRPFSEHREEIMKIVSML
jgi:hypothetical protein